MTEKRLIVMSVFFIRFAFLLEVRITALVCGDYWEKAEKQTTRAVDVSMGRADIVDCNLRKMTGTESSVKALITSETDLQNVFESIREEDREKFYKRIKSEAALMVDMERPSDYETIYTISKRYSSMNMAQHLIGYVNMENDGIAGIEKAYNDKLKDNGEKIKVSFRIDGAGNIFGDIKNTVEGTGKVLSLTIDNSMQRLCEETANKNIENGSIVVLETKTGKIKAMASTPLYDANKVVDFLNSDNSPMLNKAIQCYEPGSVIKPLWAATLLENGYNKNEIYDCKGYTIVDGHIFHCANNRVHGEMDMKKALEVSCNCYFIDTFIKNKGHDFCQMANQVNFGHELKLCDNFYTKRGDFPSIREIENTGIQASTCFGQGNFRVSPVHVAAYMNMIANDGIYVYPQVVEGIFNTETEECIEKIYKYDAKRIISETTAKEVKEMLVNVVNEGAKGRACPEYLTAAGKTGTAQTGKRKDDGEEIFVSWFCGFYPADNPKYTICITMYDGGESSVSAAPLFKEICHRIFFKDFSDTPPEKLYKLTKNENNS